jgi:hypothetical protein
MNKLTPIITKYLTRKYRGVDCFQNETYLNDISNIYNILEYINQSGGFVDVKIGSNSYKQFCKNVGLTEKELRKNIFPTLEKIGLIKKSHSKKYWDKVFLTESSISMLEISDDEELSESIRFAFRTLLYDQEFGEVIKRIKSLINDCCWGKICWWEVWFCLRLDIDFEIVKSDVKSIRNLYKLKTINKLSLEKISSDFDEHTINQGEYNPYLDCVASKNNGTIDFKNLRNKISNGLGTKLNHYGLHVENTTILMTVDVQMSRNNKKINRNYKRTSDILVGNYTPSDFDYHHIVPFDNSHFNPNLHKDIDDVRNLIPITKEDHEKFPNKKNHYLIANITNDNKIRFLSVYNINDYIEIDNTYHINLIKFKDVYIPYNKNLYTKIM